MPFCLANGWATSTLRGLVSLLQSKKNCLQKSHLRTCGCILLINLLQHSRLQGSRLLLHSRLQGSRLLLHSLFHLLQSRLQRSCCRSLLLTLLLHIRLQLGCCHCLLLSTRLQT